MALGACKAHGGVVAVDLHGHLREGFRLGGVDLARHDGGARLVFGQRQFTQPGARAGAQEADVIGDLETAHGHGGDGTMGHHHGVMGGQGLKLVGGGGEFHVGDGGDAFCHLFGKADRRGKPGAHGGAALGQLHQIGKSYALCV